MTFTREIKAKKLRGQFSQGMLISLPNHALAEVMTCESRWERQPRGLLRCPLCPWTASSVCTEELGGGLRARHDMRDLPIRTGRMYGDDR
jgi:tRNA-binding EMAP/Myf-like protein